jgi:hypothetical protein
MRLTGGQGFVFPGQKPKKPLSNMAMAALLKRMGRADITVHGFRSAFRDWSEETTNFASSVAEAALSHIVGDKVEAAYRRGDLFEKRRKLMAAWATHCTTPKAATDNVTPIRKALEVEMAPQTARMQNIQRRAPIRSRIIFAGT